MPVVPLDQIVGPALAGGYGVPAINVVDQTTLEAVLTAARQERSPLIVQTSVKTVRALGADNIADLWKNLTADVEVPVALHLDHCPDRAVISECLAKGWGSVLFDASAMPVEENLRQTIEVVAEARDHGAHVEGEIESITGVEDGHGSDVEGERQTLEVCLDFIERTGVDVFAPAIGNAHGQYEAAPELDFQRVSDIVEKTGVPVALHGGTGLSADQFTELISRGCAKVNISTALKRSFMMASRDFLNETAVVDRWEPLELSEAAGASVVRMAVAHMRMFGSSGRSAA